MKIEFYYKETGTPVEDPSDFNIDYEGDVFELSFEYDETYILYTDKVGWRVIDA